MKKFLIKLLPILAGGVIVSGSLPAHGQTNSAEAKVLPLTEGMDPQELRERASDGKLAVMAWYRNPVTDYEGAFFLVDIDRDGDGIPQNPSIDPEHALDLYPNPNGQRTPANGLSPEGDKVVGDVQFFQSSGPLDHREGFVWTPEMTDPPMTNLKTGNAPEPHSQPQAISATDGSENYFVAGEIWNVVESASGKKGRRSTTQVARAAVWNASGQLDAELPLDAQFLTSTAWDMSAGAEVIAGFVKETAAFLFLTSGAEEAAAWVWTGAEYEFVHLIGYPGADDSLASEVSSNGAVVTGWTGLGATGHRLPFRWETAWKDEGNHAVQILEGWDLSQGLNYSPTPNDDGTVIAGVLDPTPGVSGDNESFIWKADGSQVVSLRELLQSEYPNAYNALGLDTAAELEIRTHESDATILSVRVDGAYSLLFLTPRAPKVDSLVADKPATPGAHVTLTPVGAVDPGGFLQRIDYYDDVNGDGVPDAGELVAGASQDADVNGYPGIVVDLTGAAVGDTFQYLAVAVDTEGNASEPAIAVLTVDDEVVEPTPVIYSESVTILAKVKGRKTDLKVQVNVSEILQPGANPVPADGATVSVTLTDDLGGTLPVSGGTTDLNGQFVSGSVRADQSRIYTATVTVSKDGYEQPNPPLGSNSDTYPD